MDRSNGCSHVDEERLGRPFCPVCWPPPCVKLCPDCLEQNACCEGYGKIGVFPEDQECSRIWLMRKSLLIHFGGLIMSALACLAITNDPDLLQAFSFSSGVVTGTVGGTDVQQVQFEVGLRGVYTKDFFFGERMFSVDDMCGGTLLGIPLTSSQDCDKCTDASKGLVTTVILGVVTYIPTIASNVNRAYYNYDVNCQKVFGTIVALFSMMMSMYTWHGYSQNCYDSFFDGEVTIPVLVPKGAGNGSSFEIDPETREAFREYFSTELLRNRTFEDLQANPPTIEELFPDVNATFLAATEVRIARVFFDWHAGVGLILVVAATILKLFDIINHCLIRTPSITRDLQEQLEYEKKYGKASKTESGVEANEDEDQVDNNAQ